MGDTYHTDDSVFLHDSRLRYDDGAEVAVSRYQRRRAVIFMMYDF